MKKENRTAEMRLKPARRGSLRSVNFYSDSLDSLVSEEIFPSGD